jgi:GNAT superfamily N-acetyltransferase
VVSELRLAQEAFDGPGTAVLLAAYARELEILYPRQSLDRDQPVLAEEFLPPQGCWLVAYLAAIPVGCAGFKRRTATRAEGKRLYVDPGARGAHVARTLLEGLEERARGAGYGTMMLDTGARQPHALALFRSSGYRDIPRYNENPFAAHWLEKPLDPASTKS